MPVECQLSASRAPVEDLSNYGLPAIIFQAKIVCIHLGYEFRVVTLFFDTIKGLFSVFSFLDFCVSCVPVCVPVQLAHKLTSNWHSNLYKNL